MSLPFDSRSGVELGTDAAGQPTFTLPDEGHAIFVDGREFRLHWTEIVDGEARLCGRTHVRAPAEPE